MRVASCLVVFIALAGLGCAAPRAFVLSDPDKPLPGNFGDGRVGLQASDVDASLVSMPAGNSLRLGVDVTSLVAETMNRSLDARASAEGLSTTVTVREVAGFHSQVFTIAVETRLPSGSVVATRTLDTQVAPAFQGPVMLGLWITGICGTAPISACGSASLTLAVPLPLLIVAMVLAVPGLAALIAILFVEPAFLDARIRTASNLVVSAVRENALEVRKRLRQGDQKKQRAPEPPELTSPAGVVGTDDPPPMPNAARWFYAEGSTKRGPVDDARLHDAIARGAVRGDTLVWHQGLSAWRPARDVEELATPLRTAQPPSSGAPSAAPTGPPGAWHYAVGDERKGPVDGAALVALLDSGAIGRDTLVWQKGMAEWQPVRAVKALQPHLKSRAPSPSVR